MYYYENENGDNITIDYYSDEYILSNIDGVDSLSNDITIVKGLYQDGSFISNTNVPERSITISGVYKANDILKRNLIKVFNPKVKGTLYRIKNGVKRRINCTVETSPVFKVGSYVHEFQVVLFCSNPFWEDDIETEVLFSSITPMLEFPVEFIGEFEMSTLDNMAAKDVENLGDVEAPIIVEFRANDIVVNPYIQGSDLDFIKLNITLQKGDRALITTEYGNKNITINRADGSVEKGFKYLHYKSRFIQLKQGVTRFTYGSDEGVNNLSISFKYIKRYIGVI